MEQDQIRQTNKDYWNANADSWFGATALPEYGVKFVTEDELHLFGDVSGKRMLEICCGSGHSLKYHAERGASELWGIDISQCQLNNAQTYLQQHDHSAKLICAPMEAEIGIPHGYFDFVYSIYGIGWTTDLLGTFEKISSYLKPGGTFIFSWGHTLNYCVSWDKMRPIADGDPLTFDRSYFDESYFSVPLDGSEVIFCNRKISTYINALSQSGFCIEQMIEQTDENTLAIQDPDIKSRKAQMLPLSFCFKARKL